MTPWQPSPTANGWHDVLWPDEPSGDVPHHIYLRVTDNHVTWGWDEEDDPEWIGYADAMPEGFRCRPAPPWEG